MALVTSASSIAASTSPLFIRKPKKFFQEVFGRPTHKSKGNSYKMAPRPGTDKLTGVLRRLEQRRCRFEHPRDPRSMGLFRRLVREALPKIAVEKGGPNLKQKMGTPL